jgi:hypothetical protein
VKHAWQEHPAISEIGSFPIVENPLAKIRSGAGAATSKVRGGATGSWSKLSDGAGGAWGKARDRVSGFGANTRERATNLTEAARDGAADLWDRSGGAGLVDSARSNPRVAIAWAALGVLVLAWIAWTIYVWSSNGSRAGLGVLISWPIVFGALAMIAAPFVLVTVLVRRHRDGEGGAAMAGGAEDPDSVTGGTYPG